jgi:hypothetical protein
MVRKTLEARAKVDYPNFEVLVMEITPKTQLFGNPSN